MRVLLLLELLLELDISLRDEGEVFAQAVGSLVQFDSGTAVASTYPPILMPIFNQ